MTSERLIKKYPNRRLYDTEESRYVTLAEVRQLVIHAIPFRVVDSQTGEDLTRAILLQIILEQESGGAPLFTAAMLARFIRCHGDTAQATFTTFLDQSLESFVKQQRLFSERMQDAMSGNPLPFLRVEPGGQNMASRPDIEAMARGTQDVVDDREK